MSPVERLVQQFRRELDRLDGENLASLARAFDRNVYKRIAGDMDALIKLLTLEKLGADVRRTTEFKRLMANIEASLNDWQTYMRMTVPQVAGQGILYGTEHAAELVSAYEIKAAFNKLNPMAIEKLLGYLEEGGPLYKKLELMSSYNTGLITDAILEGVAAGKNPKVIAANLTKNLGMALTDSLRTARTVQVWSYREANRASFIANSDVVEGWIWYATLDDDCCMSCVAMHGTKHTNDEVLDDHYNGKCVMVPVVVGGNPGIQTGEDWFKGLSEDKQRSMMGAQYFEAYQGGAFNFLELSKEHTDDVYGFMRGVAPLYDLLGAEPPYQN